MKLGFLQQLYTTGTRAVRKERYKGYGFFLFNGKYGPGLQFC